MNRQNLENKILYRLLKVLYLTSIGIYILIAGSLLYSTPESNTSTVVSRKYFCNDGRLVNLQEYGLYDSSYLNSYEKDALITICNSKNSASSFKQKVKEHGSAIVAIAYMKKEGWMKFGNKNYRVEVEFKKWHDGMLPLTVGILISYCIIQLVKIASLYVLFGIKPKLINDYLYRFY